MPGRLATIKDHFSGRPWGPALGRALDEILTLLSLSNNALQAVPGTPTTVQAGVSSSPGTTSGPTPPALEDHRHAIETAAPIGLSNANSEGSGSALMRATAGIKRDVRVKLAGADVGTRNALSFSADFAVTDNAGADRVDVALAGLSPSDQELLGWVAIAMSGRR